MYMNASSGDLFQPRHSLKFLKECLRIPRSYSGLLAYWDFIRILLGFYKVLRLIRGFLGGPGKS